MNYTFKKEVYRTRRNILIERIRAHSNYSHFMIMVMADFEDHRYDFRQESSFYYLSGIEEPGSILILQSTGETTLFIPQYAVSRAAWVSGGISLAEYGSVEAARWGVDEIRYAGEAWNSFSASLFFDEKVYGACIEYIKKCYQNGYAIGGIGVKKDLLYVTQNILWRHFENFLGIDDIFDATSSLHEMRRVKDVEEIGYMHEAVRITGAAHEAIAKMLEPGLVEYELQSCIESVFLYLGASGSAFPSIVASGKNSVVLHYTQRKSVIREGDVVLIDIGALYGHYAADISRTYPASGLFTDRQAEVYTLVLQAQRYIEDHVKPGMFLFNPEDPQKSLHHLAVTFFEYHGCAQFFNHRIGHFLGLDVHDVGDVRKPLQEGDVITIEPGIYLQSEGFGVRIEDDYVVVEDGFVCLSEGIPKNIDEIEELMNSAEREACDHV